MTVIGDSFASTRAGDSLEPPSQPTRSRIVWRHSTGTVSISIFDSTRQESFELVFDSGDALDEFQHPFAYTAFGGVL